MSNPLNPITITWTPLTGQTLAKCSICASIIINSPQSKQTHLDWHETDNTWG